MISDDPATTDDPTITDDPPMTDDPVISWDVWGDRGCWCMVLLEEYSGRWQPSDVDGPAAPPGGFDADRLDCLLRRATQAYRIVRP